MNNLKELQKVVKQTMFKAHESVNKIEDEKDKKFMQGLLSDIDKAKTKEEFEECNKRLVNYLSNKKAPN